MDRRDDYGYGWNEEGKRFYALKSGRRQGRVNMIAAYCNRQLMAPFTIEGSCNRNVFETWIETCLIPCLKLDSGWSLIMLLFIKEGALRR